MWVPTNNEWTWDGSTSSPTLPPQRPQTHQKTPESEGLRASLWRVSQVGVHLGPSLSVRWCRRRELIPIQVSSAKKCECLLWEFRSNKNKLLNQHTMLFFAAGLLHTAVVVLGGGGRGARWLKFVPNHSLPEEDGASRHREGAPLTECQSYFFWRVMSKLQEGFGCDNMKHHVLWFAPRSWLAAVLLLVYLGRYHTTTGRGCLAHCPCVTCYVGN